MAAWLGSYIRFSVVLEVRVCNFIEDFIHQCSLGLRSTNTERYLDFLVTSLRTLLHAQVFELLYPPSHLSHLPIAVPIILRPSRPGVAYLQHIFCICIPTHALLLSNQTFKHCNNV
jgi:hypothetical protein